MRRHKITADAAGRRRVAISNGFNRFHLTVAAAEAHSRERLAVLLTGAYPTLPIQRVLERVSFLRRRRIHRLLDRAERIPDSVIRPLVVPEVLHEAGMILARVGGMRRLALRLLAKSFALYGLRSRREIERVGRGCSVFHYRAGFGQSCVDAAKAEGMVTVCDHSIAHPAALNELVRPQGASDGLPVSPIMEAALEDINRADYVLVNSDFVRRTFIEQGYPADRVRVIYWGVDDTFLERIPERPAPRDPAWGKVKMLFAGSFSRRKGAYVLLSALEQFADESEIEKWELDIVGPLDLEIPQRSSNLLKKLPVRFVGSVDRSEVARRMVHADVFVCPSLAEGSARVVFEALACGCYVITTPNTGSIVEDGVHGRLVPACDPDALAGALRSVMERWQAIESVGRRNAALVRAQYRQRDYGDALELFYDEVSRSR